MGLERRHETASFPAAADRFDAFSGHLGESRVRFYRGGAAGYTKGRVTSRIRWSQKVISARLWRPLSDQQAFGPQTSLRRLMRWATGGSIPTDRCREISPISASLDEIRRRPVDGLAGWRPAARAEGLV